MSYRKPGLWFSAQKVEVEDVARAHRKPCLGCGKLPAGRRLKIVRGTGRHQQTDIYCAGCGEQWLNRMEVEASRARRYLRQDIGAMYVDSIRVDPEVQDA